MNGKTVFGSALLALALYVVGVLIAMWMLSGCGRPDPHWCECTASCGDALYSVDSVFWVDTGSAALSRAYSRCAELPPCVSVACECACAACVGGEC